VSVWLQFLYASDEGVQWDGIWLDDIKIADGATVLYSSQLDDTSDWSYTGWEEVPITLTADHYYLVEWRNDRGSIASVGHDYQYFILAGQYAGSYVDKYEANTPGMLVWYRNEWYADNNILYNGRGFEPPSTGPKGELLVVDSHFEPIPFSGGLWDPTADNPDDPGVGNANLVMSNLRAAMDGAFNRTDTPAWWLHDYADPNQEVLDLGSRPSVPAFHDSLAYVPGLLYPGGNYLYTVDADASVVIPGKAAYTTRVRGLDETGTMPGDDLPFLWGLQFGASQLGPGHPGATNDQYGLHIEVVEQAADGSQATIRVWNQRYESEISGNFGGETSPTGEQYVFVGTSAEASLAVRNVGRPWQNAVAIVDVPQGISYLPGSLGDEWVGVSGDDAATPAEAAAYVLEQGFTTLQGQPEPANLRYFAYVPEGSEWPTGALSPELTFTYTASSVGMTGGRLFAYRDATTPVSGQSGRDLPTLRVVGEPTSVTLAGLTVASSYGWLAASGLALFLLPALGLGLLRKKGRAGR
jgi:hypothetical protein